MSDLFEDIGFMILARLMSLWFAIDEFAKEAKA